MTDVTSPPVDHQSKTSKSTKSPATKWLKRLILCLALWFLGDFAYSQYVGYRIRDWESSVEWTAEGLLPDASEFEIGDGDVGLLMVHGFSDSPQIYRKLAPALAERGYACRAIRLPGFGSDVQSYATSELSSWRSKLRQEASSFAEKHEQVWIVAHSLGGAIAIDGLLNDSEMADGVVLITPAVEVSNERSPILPTRFWHEFGKFLLPFSSIKLSPFDLDVHDPQELALPTRNPFSPRSIVSQTFELIDANRGQAKRLRLPALVFLSPQDQVVDSPAIREFFQDLNSERKQLVSLSKSGHMAPVDYQWNEIVAAIDQFIEDNGSVD